MRAVRAEKKTLMGLQAFMKPGGFSISSRTTTVGATPRVLSPLAWRPATRSSEPQQRTRGVRESSLDLFHVEHSFDESSFGKIKASGGSCSCDILLRLPKGEKP